MEKLMQKNSLTILNKKYEKIKNIYYKFKKRQRKKKIYRTTIEQTMN
jgi:hypothetical protein